MQKYVFNRLYMYFVDFYKKKNLHLICQNITSILF